MSKKLKCPECGSGRNMVVDHHKFYMKIFCMKCDDFVKISKEGKKELAKQGSQMIESEVW